MSFIPALEKFHRIFLRQKDLRMGQLFCCMFFKDPNAVPGLFTERNPGKCSMMIEQWLIDNQHTDELPPVRQDWLSVTTLVNKVKQNGSERSG